MTPQLGRAIRLSSRLVAGYFLAGIVGCGGTADQGEMPEPFPVSRELGTTAETIELGDASLFAGIPGEGPLALEPLTKWLADDKNVSMLRVQIPWHLRSPGAPDIPPFSRAEVEFGRQLFFDRRISSDVKNFSCADCHHPRDHYAHRGHNLDPAVRHGRMVPPIFNRALGKSHFWDGRSATLEDQVLQPIFNHDEMGLTPEQLVAKLNSIPAYHYQALRLFGKVDERAAAAALSAFLRALATGPCPLDEARRKAGLDFPAWVDQIRAGDEQAAEAMPGISAAGRRGARLFFGKANCAGCHSGPNYTDESFHALGLDAKDPDPDFGRMNVTKLPADRGAFKTPSLREVEKTATYMHRGQLHTLEEVVEFYNRGGGDTKSKDSQLQPLELTTEERADLVAFLRLLTGTLPHVQTKRLPK